jgi:ferredoxin
MKTRPQLLKNVLTVTGFGALLGGVHKLLQKRPWQYPVFSRTDKSKKLYDLVGQKQRLIRPPGALEEAGFLAGCIKCNRCQDACDVGAIRLFTESDGRAAQTPYIDPAIKVVTKRKYI